MTFLTQRHSLSSRKIVKYFLLVMRLRDVRIQSERRIGGRRKYLHFIRRHRAFRQYFPVTKKRYAVNN